MTAKRGRLAQDDSKEGRSAPEDKRKTPAEAGVEVEVMVTVVSQ